MRQEKIGGVPWEKLNQQLIDEIVMQGIGWGIGEDRQVASVMRSIPRHKFVLKKYKDDAYKDINLDLGVEGSRISSPMVVYQMTSCLDLEASDSVLEIGTGSGYQTAVLARLAKKVASIDIHKRLIKTARKRLKSLMIENVDLCQSVDGGIPGTINEMSFNKIIVTGSMPPDINSPLFDLLINGGCLIAPIGGKQNFNNYGTFAQVIKEDERLHIFQLFKRFCFFTPLQGEIGWDNFDTGGEETGVLFNDFFENK